jgi:hypothetical protein
LREKAAVTDSAKEKAKLYADAEKAAAESIQSGIAAQKTARDADRAYTEAVQKDADARAKAQEDSAKRYQDALKAIEDAQRQRIDAASSQMGLIEAVFGKSSEAAAKAHASMSQLLQKEAMQSAQLGDTTGAYKLATQAVNEFRASQEALLGVMTNSLQVGDAYTQYLEAIGMKGEADQYRRQVLAGQQAGIARTLFSQGDWQGGFQAAASAETLARAGSDSKKDLFGSSVTRRGALTNAMDASAMQALRQGPVIVQPQVTLGLQDGFVNADKLKVKVERGQRFEIFAH